jgi:hypothetical protein
VFFKNYTVTLIDVVPWIMTCLRGRGESETKHNVVGVTLAVLHLTAQYSAHSQARS